MLEDEVSLPPAICLILDLLVHLQLGERYLIFVLRSEIMPNSSVFLKRPIFVRAFDAFIFFDGF